MHVQLSYVEVLLSLVYFVPVTKEVNRLNQWKSVATEQHVGLLHVKVRSGTGRRNRTFFSL
jgi:hypothetical protein